MLRGLVLALLLANLAFFAWTRGQTVRAEREPDRQPQQVRPDAVRLLGPHSAATASAAELAASAATAAASAPSATRCIEAGPFSTAEVAAAEAALATSPTASALALRWTRISDEAPDAATADSAVYRLRVDAATSDEAAVLESLPAGLLSHGFAPCALR